MFNKHSEKYVNANIGIMCGFEFICADRISFGVQGMETLVLIYHQISSVSECPKCFQLAYLI